MKKFEYKKIRGDELIGFWSKMYSQGEEGWDELVKLDIEIECGIATRYYTKYENREDVDESIKKSVAKATEFALNELGEEGWELIAFGEPEVIADFSGGGRWVLVSMKRPKG